MHENEKWASVLKHIRQIMEQAGLQHSIKWGTDTYTFQGKIL